MKFNRTTAAVTALIAIIALVIGFFAIAGGDDSAAGDPVAPADPTTEQTLTVSARDTSKQVISGVAVRLLDANGTTVTSGTTAASGEVTLTFDPKAGTYVVVADEPTGYSARDDKDGGATMVGGPPCSNVYLCIYLTVTEVQQDDGTTSFTVEIEYVTPDQHGDLDDLWFEMTPPGTATEDESALAVDDTADEILVGDPIDETTDDATTDDETTDDETTDDGTTEVAGEAGPPGLRQVCAEVRHAEVPDQNAASGIWVRGEVYGLEGGWIWVEGPTINNGDPIQVPIELGAFEAPLGINSYGDHEITRFDLGSDDLADAIDLLPTLDQGPGSVFPVDSEEGPVFDDECFDFDPQVETAAAEASIDPQAAAEVTVDEFLIGFVGDHVAGDVDHLLATLHPAVPLAFGETVCSEYVARTAGSITGADTVSVGLPVSLDLETPNGVITFPEAIPFTVEFTLTDGSTVMNDANLALHDGTGHWLTRCGVD